MHGIINRALELMVVEKFGGDFWQRLKNEAGIKMTGEFLVTEFYSDESTYRMVTAAQTLTGIPGDKIFEMYGEYFYDYSVEYGYVKLLQVLGRTPEEFLENLDTMHLCLARVYPPMKPPLFRCVKHSDGDLTIHYYSKRPRLVSIAVGLIRRSIKGLFGIVAEITVVSQDVIKGCYELHIQFSSITNSGGRQRSFCEPPVKKEDELLSTKQLLSPATFAELLPFHVLFNRDLRVLQCGGALLRKVPRIMEPKVKFSDVARVARPIMSLTYEAVLEHSNALFLLEVTMDDGNSFRMSGQMVLLEASDCVLYVASPYVVSLDDLFKKNLQVADIALYDAKRDFILASEEFEEERVLFKQLEEMTIRLQDTSKLLALEKSRTDRLLYDILPQPVAKELRVGNIVAPQRFDCVTILFSEMVNFDKFCMVRDAAGSGIEIVELLNSLYKVLDRLLQPSINPEVYKIETVHDTYLVVSGAPEATLYHAKRIAKLALSMVESVQSLVIAGQTIKLTVGLNSGEVVAGVIGHIMPRYCLFGKSMNLASRTMQYGKPGRINLTVSTLALLQSSHNSSREFIFDFHGEVAMKNVPGSPVKVWTLHRKSDAKHLNANVTKLCNIA